MTELERMPPGTGELFDVVDFDPLPQSAAAKAVLESWRQQRHGAILPDSRTFDAAQVPGYSAYVFGYEVLEDGEREYRLVECGNALAPILGPDARRRPLTAGADDCFGKRAIRLFALALDRGEPVSGRFGAVFPGHGELRVEVLAAPLADPSGRVPCIVGTIAFRHPGKGWEDEPAGA